jgi:hypothetical protein
MPLREFELDVLDGYESQDEDDEINDENKNNIHIFYLNE